MVINYQATVDKGLSHLKEGSALGEVREEEIKIAERNRTAPEVEGNCEKEIRKLLREVETHLAPGGRGGCGHREGG